MTTLATAYKASDISGTAPQNNSRPEVLTIKDTVQIVKLLPLLNKTDKSGKALHFFRFDQMPYPVVRNGKTESWTRPSLEIQGKEDPQKNYAQELKKTIAEWKKGGYDKHPDYAHQFNQMTELLKSIAPQSKVAFLVVRPNEPKIHVLVTSPTIADQLFGKAAYGDRSAIESLVEGMRKTNLGDAFDLASSQGWVELSRTGKVYTEIRYHAKAAQTVRQVTDPTSGQMFSVQVPLDVAVHGSILTTNIEDLPDVTKFVNQFPWSEDEVAEFASSGFKTLPKVKLDQIAKYNNQQTASPVGALGVPPAMPGIPSPRPLIPSTQGYSAPSAPPAMPIHLGQMQPAQGGLTSSAPPAMPTYGSVTTVASAPTTSSIADFLTQTLPPKV